MLSPHQCPSCGRMVEFVDDDICPRCNHQLTLFQKITTFYKRMLTVVLIVLLLAFLVLIVVLSIEDPSAAVR